MSWKEVKKINSDLEKSLDKLVNELSNEEVTLLNSIISKLDNSTYGLSTIKTILNTTSSNTELLKNSTYGLSALKTLITNINASSDKYTNVVSGILSKASPDLTVNGKGKITLYSHTSMTPSTITIDGVDLIYNSNSAFIGATIPFTFSFESSVDILSGITGTNVYLYYLLQTV